MGKPGLDGHSNGAEQIATRAADIGLSVIYDGIRMTPDELVERAANEQVHLLGLSILSGSHVPLVREVVALTQPKWIVPCHWDTMVTPIDAPPDMLPGVDLPGFLREIEDAGVQALPVPLLGILTLPRGPFAR